MVTIMKCECTPCEYDPEIVKLLEQYLTMAKEGQLRNIAVVAIDNKLHAHQEYVHNGKSTLAMNGAITGLLIALASE